MSVKTTPRYWVIVCGLSLTLLRSAIGVRAQECQLGAPAITIDDIAIVKAGQVVATYQDNAFFDPYYHDYVGLHFKGWSPCTDGGSWGRGPNYAEIDGAVVDSISIGGDAGCSGHPQFGQVKDQFGPPWILLVTALGPGPHTIQIVGSPAGYGSSNCTGVSVKSKPVTVWIADSHGDYGIELDSCQSPEIGAPINLATGKMYTEMADLTIRGPLPIEFVRRFDSKSTYDDAMGYGWQHSYMVRIELGHEATKTLIDAQMRHVRFNCAVGVEGNPFGHCLGVWHPNAYDHLTLTQGTDPPWQVADKHGKKWNFDASGRLTKISDRNNNWVAITYNGADSTIADKFGRSMTVTTSGGRVDHVTAGNRTVRYVYDSTSGFEHNLREVKRSDSDPTEHTVVSYVYDQYSHRLRTAIDANNHLIESHDYDSDGRVTDTRSADGNDAYHIEYSTTSQTLVANARVPAVTTTFTLDPLKQLVKDRTGGPGCSSCGDAGNATHQLYDARFNKTDITDGVGVTTHLTYDDSGNVLTRTEAYGTDNARTTTYSYESEFNLPKTISVATVGTGTCAGQHPDKVTTMTYENGNLRTEESVGCNGDTDFTHTSTYAYDDHGQIAIINGPRDDVTDAVDVTEYKYFDDDDPDINNRGRLESVQNALGQVTGYSHYDYFGNVGSVIDPNNVETKFTYNFLDQVTEAPIKGFAVSQDIVTAYGYDPVGNLTAIRLPNCFALGTACAFSYQYVYDSVNRLKEIHDRAGNTILYTYDKEGNRIREEYRDAGGLVTKFTDFIYDDFNRLSVAYFTGVPPGTLESEYWQYTYHADGNRETEQDPMGHVTTFSYDELKRLKTAVQTVAAQSLATTYEYDVQDNLISVTDPGALETIYTNSDAGWRLSAVSPDTGTTSYQYDPAGNLVIEVTNGIDVTREYDALNRPTRVVYHDTTLNVTNSYDSPAVSFGIGRRTGMTDPSGVTSYGYDRRGLVTVEQKTMDGVTYTTSYTYDKTGNLTELKFPTNYALARQGVVNFTYDPSDRVSLVTTRINDVTKPVASAFQYMPFGPRKQMTFGNSLSDTRSYDTRYRLGTWTLGSLLSYTHAFNRDSNLIARTDNVIQGNSRTFGYDEIHRLTNASGPWGLGTYCGGATYEYDKNGNRKCKGETSTSTSYIYTPNTNRLASSSGGDAATYEYDDNGNTTDDGTFRFGYNEANRLATVDDGAVATYTYDGDNRRAIKATSEATTYYFYDASGRLIQEFVPVTNSGIDYLYLHEAPVARVDWSLTQKPPEEGRPSSGQGGDDPGTDAVAGIIKAEVLFYYHTDHLGTPILMTSGSSVPMWRAEHLPFGALFSNVTADIANNLRFPGQYFDAETGLHQNWFRDYAPNAGRFVENDPRGLTDGTNLYAYAHQNPTNEIDPDGRQVVPVSQVIFGAAVCWQVRDALSVKVHGMWCGPNWTGGFEAPWNELAPMQQQAAAAPVDELDRHCAEHDICYATCAAGFPCNSSARSVCLRDKCDRVLANFAHNLEGPAARAIDIAMRRPGRRNPGPDAAICLIPVVPK